MYVMKLLEGLKADYVEVVDNSDEGCNGAKLALIVVSSQFEGLGLLKRHQKVNELLDAELKSGRIHAVTMKTWTPGQYVAMK